MRSARWQFHHHFVHPPILTVTMTQTLNLPLKFELSRLTKSEKNCFRPQKRLLNKKMVRTKIMQD